MSRGLEAWMVEEPTTKRAEALGVPSTKLTTPTDTGWPDRIFWIFGGRPLLVEFKAPGEEPEPKQVYIINELIRLGYDVEVHDNADEAIKSITEKMAAAQRPKARRKKTT